MLILTAAAFVEIFAARRDALLRSCDHGGAAGSKQPVLHFPRRDGYALAGKRERDENHLSVDARQTFASINKLLYFNVDGNRGCPIDSHLSLIAYHEGSPA